jgi:hypothetical protein
LENQTSQQGESLETADGAPSPEPPPTSGSKNNDKKKGGSRVQTIISHINIYFLVFVFILVLSAGIVAVGVIRSKKADQKATIDTQTLTDEALKELANSESKVGDPKQTLSVESNAIFTGKVLFKDSVDVAGNLRIGGTVSIAGLSVSGTSAFDQLTANKLAISGDATIQGKLAVQKELNVTNGATFGGTVSAPTIVASNFQLTKDLIINYHIDGAGSTPSKSNGTNLGSGGTASVNGSDTAGTLTINAGSGSSAGCFATITFAKAFGATPHVVISPSDQDAAAIDYYVTRTANNFKICSASNPPDNTSFSFDWVAIE